MILNVLYVKQVFTSIFGKIVYRMESFIVINLILVSLTNYFFVAYRVSKRMLFVFLTTYGYDCGE